MEGKRPLDTMGGSRKGDFFVWFLLCVEFSCMLFDLFTYVCSVDRTVKKITLEMPDAGEGGRRS